MPLGIAGTSYAIAAALLGLGYLAATIRFGGILRKPNARVARDLLRVSVLYLPLLLAAMMLDAKGRLLF